ncbi:DUF309 domain-containing protein [Bacillus salacetis]|uniref:DUF309 domain-containing protein n=1 Tax=Bacillus salacetis TaxID=2315464 RepID=A0A3A1R3K9_9BACI|nr:DUF309 domain-containing protein [Bacillus salacetis]RIW33565.1 DUF309 domain-containing protein [Bacillus salacetis]
MNYPKEYLDYLIHFHCDRDYFECHEVLEEYWKKTDPGNRDSVWVGLIQVAVGFYHFRRQNRTGAARMMQKGWANLKHHKRSLQELGIDPSRLQKIMEQTIENIISGERYISIRLPVSNELKQMLQAKCGESSSNQRVPASIIHRHSRRDRTEVIREREKALLMRKKQKD